MHSLNDRRYTVWFLVALGLLLAIAAWQWRGAPPVSSSVLELLPTNASHHDPIVQRAQAQVEAPLNRELVALIGTSSRESSVALARHIQTTWQASGLFAQVMLEPTLDIDTLRADLTVRRLALLPADDRNKLMNDPHAYATERAQHLLNPFSTAIVLPPALDWLGLGARIEHMLRPDSRLTLDAASGTLMVEDQATIWVLLRATSTGSAFDGEAPERVAQLVDQTRREVLHQGAMMRMTGGVLYAAHGKKQAMEEIQRIGFLSLAGILLVLALALRGLRSVLVFLPVAVGLVAGITATVAIFGQIHAITLLIGTTLIGVAVDFPMHWLGKCYGLANWQAGPVMRRVLPGLSISLVANLIGYLALGFTPFPALQQTAVFSAAGLLAAFATTVFLLPVCCGTWQPRPSLTLLRAAVWATTIPAWVRATRWRCYGAVACLVLFSAVGMVRLNLQDDLRLWLNLPAPMLEEATQLGRLTGFMPTSQFFLVRGKEEAEVLANSTALQAELGPLIKNGTLGGYTGLGGVVASHAEQEALKQRLVTLAQMHEPWLPLTSLGIPLDRIHSELLALAALPTLNVEQTLDSPLTERWRGLWLNDGTDMAALVTLSGLQDVSALKGHASARNTIFVNRIGELNTIFAQTRLVAAELKVASYFLAGLLLWLVLGRSATWRILAAPIAATCCSLAVLGYMGQPLTLFGLFGLLLVSAIGIDYAVFMYERIAGAPASLVGIFLSAVTTILGFGLLMLSATPVIANFGLSVTIGVAFSLLFATFVTPTKATC